MELGDAVGVDVRVDEGVIDGVSDDEGVLDGVSDDEGVLDGVSEDEAVVDLDAAGLPVTDKVTGGVTLAVAEAVWLGVVEIEEPMDRVAVGDTVDVNEQAGRAGDAT